MPRLMSPSSPRDATPLTAREDQNAWDAGYEMATPAERLADMHLAMLPGSTYVMTGRTYQNKDLILRIFGPAAVWDNQLKRWLGYGGGNGMDRNIWDLRRSGVQVTVIPGYRLKPGEPIPENKMAAMKTDWSGWQNYNTIGPRKSIGVLLGIMDSNLPATWRVLRGTDPRFSSLEKKWLGKGRTVDEKGVKGKKILYRGSTMFIGVVGGTKMAIVDGKFEPGKFASQGVTDAWLHTARLNWRDVEKMGPEKAMDALEDLTRAAGRKAKQYLEHYRMEAWEKNRQADELEKAWDKWDWDGLARFHVVSSDDADFAAEVIASYGSDVSAYSTHSRRASGKAAGGRDSFTGIDVRSVQSRTASWWDDMEKLLREWWSFHKIEVKRGRGKLLAIVPGTKGRPVWEIDIRGPINKPTVYVGGAQKSFGPDANLLEDIMYWIDSITRP